MRSFDEIHGNSHCVPYPKLYRPHLDGTCDECLAEMFERQQDGGVQVMERMGCLFVAIDGIRKYIGPLDKPNGSPCCGSKVIWDNIERMYVCMGCGAKGRYKP